MKGDWFVYILRCNDNTLYTGVTNNLEKRLLAHNGGKRGAKYTKARQPVRLVYHEAGLSRSEALKREAVVRKLPRATKIKLVETK